MNLRLFTAKMNYFSRFSKSRLSIPIRYLRPISSCYVSPSISAFSLKTTWARQPVCRLRIRTSRILTRTFFLLENPTSEEFASENGLNRLEMHRSVSRSFQIVLFCFFSRADKTGCQDLKFDHIFNVIMAHSL